MTVANDSMTMVPTKSGAGPDTSMMSEKADTTEVKADLPGMMEIGGLKDVAEEAPPATDAHGGHGVSADCQYLSLHVFMTELTTRSCLIYLLGFLSHTLFCCILS